MTAKEAHRLNVGDKVRAAFGTVCRPCQIMRIEWPHFWCHTTLKSGEERIVRHRYSALRFARNE